MFAGIEHTQRSAHLGDIRYADAGHALSDRGNTGVSGQAEEGPALGGLLELPAK